ncbi:MAG: type III effector HrpK domain-containing protein [Janthinobacterium lividum]
MLEGVSTAIRSAQQRGDDAAGRSFQSALATEKFGVVPPLPPRQPGADQNWQALAADVGRNPTAALAASDLARPLAAAQLLSQNWDKWGLHANHVDFGNPPASLPQEAKDTLRYLAANPTLLDAISAGGGGTPSSTITKANVDAYIKAATVDLSAATKGLAGTALWDGATAGLDPASRPGEAAALDTPLANAELVTANWHSWGLHDGIDFANPPADLPPDARAAIRYFGDHPTLLDAIATSTGAKAGGPVTQAEFNAYIDKARGDAKGVAGGGQSMWDGLTQGAGASDRTAQEGSLDAPIADAQLIAANWTSWGLHGGIDFAHPPADLPPEAQAALHAVASNPALMKALDGGGSGKADGTITQAEVNGFARHAADDAKAAGKSYSDWLAKNPDADESSKALARSAALVMANATLISGADPDHGAGVSDSFTARDLAAIATMPGVSPDLAQAAGFWSHSATFAMLDNGGSSPATDKPDSISTRDNIAGWIDRQAPATSADFTAMMNQAASAETVSGVDTSKVGSDIFSDPKNADGTPKYDAATKAAVLQQLIRTDTVLSAGKSGSLWEGDHGHVGLQANEGSVRRDLEDKISTLSQDPAVIAWQTQARPAALQGLVGSDGAISGAVSDHFGSQIASGKALDTLLGSKDSSGKPVSDGAALLSFASQYQFYAEATGTGGKPAANVPTPQDIVARSSQAGRLNSEYVDGIVSGKALRDKLAGGEDIGTATQEVSVDAAGFAAVLDPRVVSDNAGALQSNYTDAISTQLLGKAPASAITDAAGGTGGGLDDGKINAILQQLQKQDPDIFKNADGSAVSMEQVSSLIKQAWDAAGRQPAKVLDALGKITGDKPTNALNAQYSKGTLHLASAFFSGLTLIGKSTDGPRTPAQIASVAATGIQFAGLVLEGSAKLSKDQKVTAWGAADVKQIEALGKTLGGVASSVGGALGIVSGVQSLASGDKVGAGLNLTSGILGVVSGGIGITDGVVSGFGIGGEVLAGALGLAGGITAGIGALLGIGILIWQLVEQAKKHNQDENTFYGQIDPVLQQYGITGGGFAPDPEPKPAPDLGGRGGGHGALA